jgi:hypothetical protein
MPRREKELRCFCRGNPLLATYGVDSKGILFVHVKIYKQDRIYGELVFEGGIVKIRCRNCLRWHRVIFKEHAAALTEDQAPEAQADIPSAGVLDGSATG